MKDENKFFITMGGIVLLFISLLFIDSIFHIAHADVTLDQSYFSSNASGPMSGTVSATNNTFYGICFDANGNYSGAKAVGGFSENPMSNICGTTGPGAYHWVGVLAVAPNCISSTYSNCMANPSQHQNDICFDVGGSFCNPNPPIPDLSGIGATSSIDQEQTNIFYGFYMFFLSMYFIVWFFKKI